MRNRRDYADLVKQFLEQFGFLIASSNSYDQGYESEAKRLAVCMRILLYDNSNKSKSVLMQLGKKNNILFTSFAEKYSENNLLDQYSLVYERTIKENSSTSTKYIPWIEAPPWPTRNIPFDVWWEEVVISNKEIKFSRKDIILHVANTDGGAHVDASLDQAYISFARDDSIGATLYQNDIIIPSSNDVIMTSIRTIATELFETLNPLHKELCAFTK